MATPRQLAQYFTPAPVVRLAFDLLEWLEPGLRAGRLVDPSCGAGAFLLGARDAGFPPAQLYGLDLDPALVPVWREAGLMGPAGAHLALTDGLAGGGQGQFDFVAGNPPFAGSLPLAEPLQGRFHYGRLVRTRQQPPALPRELWFLERSLQLLRPGGVLALVLPEGIFANRRWEAVRADLLQTTQVEAIIGLPRSTFRASRTTVKTCLLLARKQALAPGHRVRLVELTAPEVETGAAPLVALWEREEEQAEGVPWPRV